jgi:fumarylacetoacetase-like protein
MKLATLANGTRDGRLVVVSRHLAYATGAHGIASTLQQALDDWPSFVQSSMLWRQRLMAELAIHA